MSLPFSFHCIAVSQQYIINTLPKGIYIINGKKVVK